MPAWIVAQDLLVKAKDALRILALEIYRNEIKGKSVALEGKLVHLPDEHNEDEEDLFVVGKLVEDRDRIGRIYQEYIIASAGSRDPERIITAERARKFLIALGHLLAVVDYSDIFDDWIEDAGMLIRKESPVEVIADSSGEDGRADALRFLVGDRKFLLERVFSSEEHKILQDALEIIDQRGS
jgi:hypothetical protein